MASRSDWLSAVPRRYSGTYTASDAGSIIRGDLAEWVDGLDQTHVLALIDAMERLDSGIKQFGWKDVSELMREHGIPKLEWSERPVIPPVTGDTVRRQGPE
jgi:hypothetical protein